jgi:hypothetical protein
LQLLLEAKAQIFQLRYRRAATLSVMRQSRAESDAIVVCMSARRDDYVLRSELGSMRTQ